MQQNEHKVLKLNLLGVAQNYKEAVKWYLKAAEQGHASAQSNLSYMYFNGHGVTQSYETCYVWASVGAANGDEKAIRFVGI